MQIKVVEFTEKGLKTLSVTHKNKSSTWDVRSYVRAGASEGRGSEKFDLIFKEINGYWASLPGERQDAIWQCYVDIEEILTTYYDAVSILTKLQQKVKVLYDLMPLAELTKWVQYYGDVRMPSNLKAQYDPSEPYPKERTYLRSDYQELVMLAIATRPMVPVWGEYITRTRNETGTTFKESMAMKLLYHSQLAKCPPMERLRVYIEWSVENGAGNQQGASFAAILGGLGTTELPDWLLASTVVRRISVGPVSSPDDNSSIISNIYNYVTNTLRSIDRRFKGHVSEKRRTTSESGDDPNISLAEMYKVKQEIPDGDRVILNVYTEEPLELAGQVDAEVDLTKVEKSLKLAKALERLPIHAHQIVLVQWSLAKCFPARGVQLLSKPSLIRAICVTQALLWHWGFPDLAVLVSAEEQVIESDTMISTIESRSRIPKDLMDELIDRFPHQYHPRGKHQSIRQTNVASRAVDTFCELINRNDWLLHAPNELIALSSRIGSSQRMMVPPDIRAQVARLIIHLNDAATFI